MRSRLRDRELMQSEPARVLSQARFARYPPTIFTSGKNRWSDAHQFPSIPPTTKSIDYGGGLLPELVEHHLSFVLCT